MTRPTVNTLLPREVIERVFECWTFEELLPVMRVCALWRRIVLDNPAYWSEINLYSTTDAAVALFLLRLSRTRARPISVRLDVRQPEDIVSTAILPAIERHVDHILCLFLGVHSSHFPAAAAAISHAAPHLETLHLTVVVALEDRIRPQLRPDVFARHAPLLEYVSLWNVILPPGGIPAFLNALFVGYGGGGRNLSRIGLPAFWDQFPNMKHLTLFGFCDILGIDSRDLEACCRLQSLSLMLQGNNLVDAMQHLPLWRIPYVHTVSMGAKEAENLITQIPGQLNLTVEDPRMDDPNKFILYLAGPNALWCRSFTEDLRNWAGHTAPILSCVDVAARLTSITIANSLWTRLRHFFAPFPNAMEIRFNLEHSTLDEICSAGLIHIPRLRTVIVRCEFDTIAVHRAHLVAIARTVFAQARLPLQLALENTVLQGESSDFSMCFASVSYRGLAGWRYPSI